MSDYARKRWLSLGACLAVGLPGVGLAVWAGQRLRWPFSFGVPLFALVFFFMALVWVLARYTPLSADHPSHQRAGRATAISRMGTWRRRLLRGELGGGILAIGIGIVLLVLPAVDASRSTSTWQAASCVLLALGCGLLAHAATLMSRVPAQEYVRHAGTPASARVLSVTNMGYRQHGSTYDQARWYRLELEVQPTNGAPYTTTIEQMFRKRPSSMPKPGALVPVRHIPEEPNLVVVLFDVTDH